ncbi:PTS cellobiose transporter subunit IIC [Candidatus Cetobacterium colombiensis]|uniref:Permease IIC component n=1 Tax=Candidatus Cetobacterium colombiensis TaxID=3073100 RepID=A0ABU4W9C7_9FUSO|nr:PTS cellobiose transporter subunit IIC [Candidatus Cetobacterium colombiensis]MDX8336118.1 PTS cellobiose transporter subunit IIC [Candidatus Cetobacterium colombiensis]
MNNFMNFMEEKLMPIAAKVGQNRYLNAIKDGFVYTMPFLIIGSFILLMVNLPFTDPNTALYIESYAKFMGEFKGDLVQPFYVSMGIMSLFVSYGIGMSLSNSYALNSTTGGFLSMYAFLLVSAKLDWLPIGQAEGAGVLFLIPDGGWMPIMDARYLDAKGLFTAIFGAIIAIEIFKILVKRKFVIRLPDSVPPAIAKSFELLIPIVFVTIIFHTINLLVINSMDIMVPEIILKTFAPLLNMSDSLLSLIIILIIIHLFWFAGLHGTNIVVAIVNSITLSNLAANQAALQAGEALPKIFAGGFVDSFIFMGGVGTTLGLTLAMIRSNNAHIKSIGKLSLLPAIFNINEPIMFGTPIVMNPLLFIPFITVPIINGSIAWFATKYGLVSKIVTLVPWTTPGPLAALLATNFDISAAILSLALVLLAYFIYTPFLKLYTNSLNESEV